ncbi:XisI protein [Microcoleus sp. LEGE 07076]|uniref:XisI protein n=1 Tax=Microcoleus sp. LEGE 07076 TaxID=915322 RepID=UPI0018804458|nr:XisI protein [Microcoleus sp. LEGE 07076]MBE9186548.1 XisI protein [Microcoleus sp. LEGE 07076]
MDKIENYRTLIKKILSEYDRLFANQTAANTEMLLAFDEKRDRYLWFQVGWQQNKRVRGITVCIQIKNNKIWIEEDWTEEGIANELLKEGVPQSDIVLAFHHPDDRPLTDFAVA